MLSVTGARCDVRVRRRCGARRVDAAWSDCSTSHTETPLLSAVHRRTLTTHTHRPHDRCVTVTGTQSSHTGCSSLCPPLILNIARVVQQHVTSHATSQSSRTSPLIVSTVSQTSHTASLPCCFCHQHSHQRTPTLPGNCQRCSTLSAVIPAWKALLSPPTFTLSTLRHQLSMSLYTAISSLMYATLHPLQTTKAAYAALTLPAHTAGLRQCVELLSCVSVNGLQLLTVCPALLSLLGTQQTELVAVQGMALLQSAHTVIQCSEVKVIVEQIRTHIHRRG